MENDEEPITHMARIMYEHWRKSPGLCPDRTWPSSWDALHPGFKYEWEVIAAHSHLAYHDQYEYLMIRSKVR